MYVLEFETKNKLRKIKGPRKARISDRIFFDTIQIMDDNGKWHTICNCWIGITEGQIMIERINRYIADKKPYIYVDI